MKRLMQAGLAAMVVIAMFAGLIGVAGVSAREDTETYTSPTFGVSLEYDGGVWSSFLEADADENGGRDILGLETKEIRGGLIIEVHDLETDADDCLEELFEEVFEGGLAEADDLEPREDDDGEPIEGSSRGSAWAAYNYLSEGSHLSAYLSCQEWGNVEGVITFTLITASQDFDAGLALTEPIFDSVGDPDTRASDDEEDDRVDDEDDRDREDEDDEDDRDREDEDDEDDRDREDDDEEDDGADEDEDDRDRDETDVDEVAAQVAESGVYESQLYGFTVPINVENWELTGFDSDNDNESVDFAGPRRENLDIMALRHNGAPLSDYPDYYVESMAEQGDFDIEVYVDPDTGDTIERRHRQEVYTLYTFEYDGNEYLLYLHAVTSDDNRYVVMVIGISLVSSYDLLEEDVFPLLDQIEF